MGGSSGALAFRGLWPLVGLVPLFVACDGGSPTVGQQDVLVLELGGERPSLRRDLLARGVPVALPHPVRAVVTEPPPNEAPTTASPDEPPGPQQGDGPDAPPAPGPEIAPPQPTGFRVVKLKRGQTLMHLSKEHFGTTRRWKEIMDLNGWSEAQVNRLPADQDVKIPVDAGQSDPNRVPSPR